MSSVQNLTLGACIALACAPFGCASLLGADFERGESSKVDAAPADAAAAEPTTPETTADAANDASAREIRDGNGRWSVEGTPGMLTPASKIWGPTPDLLYIVSPTGGALRSYGDGTWSPALFLDPGFPFRAMWGSSGQDMYVVGDSIDIGHCGAYWDLQKAPSDSSWRAIWGSSKDDVYIGGDYGAIGHSIGDGIWQPQTTDAKSAISEIWGSGPGDVYAISLYDVFHATGTGTWDVSFHAPGRIRGLWGSASDDVYVVGADAAVHHRGANGEWSTTFVGTKSFSAVWGSGRDDVYVGGEGGTILHRGRDGTWERDEVGTSENIVAIWGTSPGNVYALTEANGHGSVLHRSTK